MNGHSRGLLFFVNGAAALVVLFFVTLLMQPAPQVNALRALIGVGLVIVGVKAFLRYNNINWPGSRR